MKSVSLLPPASSPKVYRVNRPFRRDRGKYLVFCKSKAEAQRVNAFLKADRAERGRK